MKPAGLIGLLRQTIALGDINASCGVLRRIFSETLQESIPAITTASPSARYTQQSSSQQHQQRPQKPALGHQAVTSALYARSTPDSGPAPSSTPPSPSPSLSLVEQVLQLGRSCLQSNPHQVKPSSISILCHTAQRSGEWATALQLCTHLHDQPPSPLFLSSLLRPGNVAPTLQYCEARGWSVDITSAMQVLSDQGGWADALAVAQGAERRFSLTEPYTLGVLVPFLAASGASERAAALFDSGIAQGALVEAGLVRHLVEQTATPRQWRTCLHMLHTLARTRESAHLLPDSPAFFRRIMEVSPSWRTSLGVFHLARSCEVKPDARTVSILLTQCDSAGAWEEATKIYDVAVRENFVDSLSLGTTYHTLVRAFSAARQWEKALEALSWMSQASEASSAAGKSELVELCAKAGQWEAALAIGASLLETSPELLSSETVLSLLFACSKGAQWVLATRIFANQLSDVRVQPHPVAVCAVIEACVAANHWTEALRVFHVARAQQPRVVVPPMAHRLVVKACAASHCWREATTMLAIMSRDGLPLDNHSQRLGMWAAALHGEWELSLSFLRGIPSQRRTPQDRMVVRNATRLVGPTANAVALKYLQSH